jgi:hypothetical protein
LQSAEDGVFQDGYGFAVQILADDPAGEHKG